MELEDKVDDLSRQLENIENSYFRTEKKKRNGFSCRLDTVKGRNSVLEVKPMKQKPGQHRRSHEAQEPPAAPHSLQAPKVWCGACTSPPLPRSGLCVRCSFCLRCQHSSLLRWLTFVCGPFCEDASGTCPRSPAPPCSPYVMRCVCEHWCLSASPLECKPHEDRGVRFVLFVQHDIPKGSEQ